MRSEDFWVESFVVGPLAMRCSVVTDLSTGDTVIIDGGAETERIISWINDFAGQGPNMSNGPVNSDQLLEYGVSRNVIALVNTHAHFDHSGEVPLLLEEYNVSWYLHDDDTYLQSQVQNSARRYGIELPKPAIADKQLHDGMELKIGSLLFQVFHTPGHSLGSCCLLIEIDDGPNHLISGDVIFAGSIGRTDLPNSGGDFGLLAKSIFTRLWPLEDDTIVHPGHGPMTTIGLEKSNNPFVGVDSQAFADFH